MSPAKLEVHTRWPIGDVTIHLFEEEGFPNVVNVPGGVVSVESKGFSKYVEAGFFGLGKRRLIDANRISLLVPAIGERVEAEVTSGSAVVKSDYYFHERGECRRIRLYAQYLSPDELRELKEASLKGE